MRSSTPEAHSSFPTRHREPTRPLRVAYVSEIPTPYRRPFLERLAQEPDLDLTVWYLAAGQADRSWRLEPPLHAWEHVLRGVHWCAERRRGQFNRFNPGVLRVLNARRYDVAVFGAYYVMSLWMGIYACRWRGLPYVLQCESHGRRARSGVRTALKRALVGRLIRDAGAWLPLGTWAREYLAEHGADPRRSFLCPNAPDVDALQAQCRDLPGRDALRDRLGVPREGPLFAYVGRFVEHKRVDLVLDAYARLSAQGVRAALALAGDGPLEARLRARVQEERIPNVRFLGFREPGRLAEVYAAADALALASDDEPWGVVVHEALACGTPAVVSDRVGAGADLVREGRTGWTFPAGDAQALCRTLESFADDPDLRDRLAPEAQAVARAWGYARCVAAFRDAVRTAQARGRAGEAKR